MRPVRAKAPDAHRQDAEGLLPHLRELRQRLIRAALAYLLGVVVLMNFSDEVFAWISGPIRAALPPGSPLVFLNAPDVFFTYLKIAFVLSVFVTAPYTFYQLWAFVAPGLYRHERRAFLGYFLTSVGLLLAGGAFAFEVVFPLVFRFFIGFSTPEIVAMPSVREYLTLVLKMLFAFGLAFQIPILMLILARLDLVTPETMAEKRRFVIVWVFIVAAVLTPPDVISQALLAVPMLLLYELGLWLVRWRGRARGKTA
ncbi:MAG: twin-arginine translocase subunit TatC [Mariprofundaceae bacterium]